MHVCIVYHHYFPADFSTAINEYARHLSENGVEVTVIAGREDPSVSARDDYHGVEVHRILTDLSTSVSPEPTRFAYRALRLLDDICGSRDVDLLHLRSFPNLGLVMAPLPWLQSPSTVLSDVRGTAVSNAVFEFISRVGIRIQDFLVDETVVIDELVAERIFPDQRDVPILPLGVDFDNFDPIGPDIDRTRWGFTADDIVVGYTGNLHSSRELSRLVEAFASAHRRNNDLKLVIVGDGAARPELERTVAGEKIEDAVVFSGRIPFDDVPRYLRSFDIGAAFVADKNQYRNQPPLKTVEFLASGIPVVATDTPGNRQFAENDHNGIVVPDETTAIADAIFTLGEEISLRERLATNARASVSEYDYERIVTDELIPLYRRLCGEKTQADTD